MWNSPFLLLHRRFTSGLPHKLLYDILLPRSTYFGLGNGPQLSVFGKTPNFLNVYISKLTCLSFHIARSIHLYPIIRRPMSHKTQNMRNNNLHETNHPIVHQHCVDLNITPSEMFDFRLRYENRLAHRRLHGAFAGTANDSPPSYEAADGCQTPMCTSTSLEDTTDSMRTNDTDRSVATAAETSLHGQGGLTENMNSTVVPEITLTPAAATVAVSSITSNGEALHPSYECPQNQARGVGSGDAMSSGSSSEGLPAMLALIICIFFLITFTPEDNSPW